MSEQKDIAENGVRAMLRMVGMNPDDDGVANTPKRVVKAFQEMTAGYGEDPSTILATRFDGGDYDQMIVVRGIEFVSLCEHHLLPFAGTAVVAYIPRGKVVGLSKIPRLVQTFARRLQLQERLTQQIADALAKHLDPKGVGVVLRARHSCMGLRGVKQDTAEMVTSCIRGAIMDKPEARAELMSLK